MIKNLLMNPHFQFFVGGFVVGTLGLKALKSEKSRNLCINGLAKFIMVQKSLKESYENMKEEALDICHDAEQAAFAPEDAPQ